MDWSPLAQGTVQWPTPVNGNGSSASVKVGLFLTIWATLSFWRTPLRVWSPSHNFNPQKPPSDWVGTALTSLTDIREIVGPNSDWVLLPWLRVVVFTQQPHASTKMMLQSRSQLLFPYIPAIQFIIIPSADTANNSANDICEVHERREHFICHFWSEGCGDFLPVMPHAASWPSNSLVQCNPSRHDGGWIGCVRACPCHVVCSHVTVHRSIG
jgi:hypothetical protein